MPSLQLKKGSVVKNFPFRSTHIEPHYLQFTKAGVGNYFVDLTTNASFGDTSVKFTKGGTVYYPRTQYIANKSQTITGWVDWNQRYYDKTDFNQSKVKSISLSGWVEGWGFGTSPSTFNVEIKKGNTIIWKYTYTWTYVQGGHQDTHSRQYPKSGKIEVGDGTCTVRTYGVVNQTNTSWNFKIDYEQYI